MASEVKPARIFNLDVLNYACASWEEGYGLAGLAWVKWSGLLPEWDEAIEWRANTLLALTAPDPANQWNRRWPCPYRVPVVRMRTLATGVVVSAPSIAYNANPEPYAEETPDSWSELWGLFEQWMATTSTPITVGTEDKIYENRADNPNTAPSGPHYHEVELGAVTALGLAGVPGAAEQAAWLRSKMQPVYDSYNSSGSSYRYAYYPA